MTNQAKSFIGILFSICAVGPIFFITADIWTQFRKLNENYEIFIIEFIKLRYYTGFDVFFWSDSDFF